MKKTIFPSEQGQRFIEAARQLGCDESEERFVETVRKLASAPPVRNAPSKGKKKATSNQSKRS